MTPRLLLSALLAATPLQGEEAELSAAWESEIFPIVEFHCYECHGDGITKGDLDLDVFDSIASMQADREQWKRIRAHIDQRLMPPIDEEPPTDEERTKLLNWIDSAIFPVDPEKPDPGRVTLRRLNRLEYENTLRDLLGVNVRVQDLLPPDDSGYGFDHIGDVLTLSPAHMERFLETARISLDKAIHPEPMPFRKSVIQGNQMVGSGRNRDNGRLLYGNGTAEGETEFKLPGRYLVRVVAGGMPAGEDLPRMELALEGEKLKTWEVGSTVNDTRDHDFEITIADSGTKTMGVSFINDYYDENHPDRSQRDRNLLVSRVEVIGPVDGPRPPKPQSHQRIYGERSRFDSDREWAADIFSRFVRLAFRRPPEAGEAERYLHFIDLAEKEGRSIESGIRHGLEAVLVSPSFLFREEPQPEPDNAEHIHVIDEHALANRLSYFLWSTMPDPRLMELADKGELRENLDREIERMLESTRSNQFIAHFTGQWLHLRDVSRLGPSRKAFPRFDRALRPEMARETELLFGYMARENRPITDLIDADYTFVTGRLARHYGIKGVEGREFQKVSLKGTPRRGILGHGSFLMSTSHPLRTSPVLRGKFVLENLLGMAPPPPPPNIPQLTPPTEHGSSLTLRQQMEKHREDPGCASCHALMDPIGFGLENYDGVGSWRTEDGGQPIDASGELQGGRKFVGADGLREILLSDYREAFLRSVASKMLTYALGRGTDWYDKPAIDQIVRDTAKAKEGTRDMIKAVIHSVPFQYRRGDG